MELIVDGSPVLPADVQLIDIGCDTVILHDVAKQMLYINAHMKDYKPPKKDKKKEEEFKKQMTAILKVVSHNADKQCVLMADANTQFLVRGESLTAYSKEPEAGEDVGPTNSLTFELPGISAVIATEPTSFKMRGPHTAQTNKILRPVNAVIDHVVGFNGVRFVSTAVYTLNGRGLLTLVSDQTTLTTMPNCIADHALVVSTAADGTCFGTLNIKGGNKEDQAWAEFVPAKFYDFFSHPAVKALIIEHLLPSAFSGYAFKANEPVQEQLLAADFLSKPRSDIYNINLANDVTPHLEVTADGSILVERAGRAPFALKKAGDHYVVDGELDPSLGAWVDLVSNELKNKEVEEFFLTKGYRLYNFWHAVQNNTDATPFAGMTLKSVFEEWFAAYQGGKVTIAEMIRQAKALAPTLSVVAIQEMPPLADEIIAEINALGGCKIFVHDSVMSVTKEGKTKMCVTKGAIVVFGGRGGRRSNGSRRRARGRRNGSRRKVRRSRI
jgi:hypothetical protein